MTDGPSVTGLQEERAERDPDSKEPDQKRRRWVGNVALILASLLFTVGVAEFGARVYGWVADPPVRSTTEFIRQRPAPYKDSAYFSSRFLKEADAVGGLKGYRKVAGANHLLPNDHRGQHINVIDGVRRTTDQPAQYDRRVLVFGGSTMFGAEVPDQFTIPSHLQRLLNQASMGSFQVVNLGVGAANAVQELDRLRNTPISDKDIVIFYDGVNEITGGVYLGNPSGSIHASEETSYANMGLVRRFVYRWHARLQKRSAFVRFLLTPKQQVPSHMNNDEAIGRLAMETRQAYSAALVEAQEYATQHGAAFAHFLQPNLLAASERTDYERQLLENPYLVLPGVAKAFETGYPILQAEEENLRRANVESFDLTQVLEPRKRPGQEVYLDYCHVTEGANARIAEAIFSRAFSRSVPA